MSFLIAFLFRTETQTERNREETRQPKTQCLGGGDGSCRTLNEVGAISEAGGAVVNEANPVLCA